MIFVPKLICENRSSMVVLIYLNNREPYPSGGDDKAYSRK